MIVSTKISKIVKRAANNNLLERRGTKKPRFFFCVVEDLRQRTLMRKKPIENLLQFIKEFAIIMIPKQTALDRNEVRYATQEYRNDGKDRKVRK